MHIEDWTFKDMVLVNIESRLKASLERLETESSTNVLYETQGKVAGLKVGRDKIIEEFGPLEGTMIREAAPDVAHLNRAQLEAFSEDIVRNKESWQKITDSVKEWEAQAKDDLWGATSIVSREVKRAHGQRDGMKTFEELMDKVGETLMKVKESPTLFDQAEADEADVAAFPEEDFEDMEGEYEETADELDDEEPEDLPVGEDEQPEEEDVIPFPESPVGENYEEMAGDYTDDDLQEEEEEDEGFPQYGE